MVRHLLDKAICQACLALGYEAGDLGSSLSWVTTFLFYGRRATILFAFSITQYSYWEGYD